MINFLIIGGGIAGLACAFALRRVGHRVIVLEKDANVDGDGVSGKYLRFSSYSRFLSKTCGGIRLPPNGTKILFDWGLKEELRKIGTKTDAITMFLCLCFTVILFLQST